MYKRQPRSKAESADTTQQAAYKCEARYAIVVQIHRIVHFLDRIWAEGVELPETRLFGPPGRFDQFGRSLKFRDQAVKRVRRIHVSAVSYTHLGFI